MQHLFGHGSDSASLDPAIADGTQHPPRRRGLGSSGEIASLLLAGRRDPGEAQPGHGAVSERGRYPTPASVISDGLLPPDMTHLHEAGDLSTGAFHGGSMKQSDRPAKESLGASSVRDLPPLPLSRLPPPGGDSATERSDAPPAPRRGDNSSRRGSLAPHEDLDYPGAAGLSESLSARQPMDFRGIGPGIDEDPRFMAATGRRGSVAQLAESAAAAAAAADAAAPPPHPGPSGDDDTPYQRFLRLDDGDFPRTFGMTRTQFEALPKWRRLEARKAKGFF
jgi:hypothetical protein